MAETIRYDTSDDPVAAQAIAEKEAESLKIGEELMSKQDKMLAGKYKSAEELESDYLELQKKLGDTPNETPQADEPKPEYDVENQRQIIQSITTIKQQLNISFQEDLKNEQDAFNYFLS